MFSAHSNADCGGTVVGTFKTTYINHYDKDGAFFIKGVVLKGGGI